MDFTKNPKKRYMEGDNIFSENDSGDEMYYILSGQVNIFLKIGDNKEDLVLLEPGSFFGELALFNRSQRNAYAEASKDTELLVITKENLKDIIHKNPDLTFQLVHTMSKHLERLTHQYEEALQQNVEWDVIIK